MMASRMQRIGVVVGLAAVVAGASLWWSVRAPQLRYNRLAKMGVIGQHDRWGRTTQINLWPRDMDAEGLELLSQLTHLQLLNLSSTDFSDDQLRYVEGIDSLNELILVRTQVTDAGLQRLTTPPHLPHLRRIVVTPSAVTSAGVLKLKRARPELKIALNPLALHGLGHLVPFGGHGELNDEYELVALDLHNSAVTDEDMRPVLACKNLRMVNLSGTRIGDDGLACLRNLEGVRELWLTGTNVSDAGLDTVVGFTKLKSISLARTKVSDEGIAKLRSLTELEVVHLGETTVSDAGLRYLRDLHHLKEVYATESLVTTDGAAELTDAIPTVEVFGGSEPEKPVEEIESRVLG